MIFFFFFFWTGNLEVFLVKFKDSYCNSFGDDSRSVVWVSLLHMKSSLKSSSHK